MATVHFGRLLGPVGFSRTVAIKRLHPQFAKDPEFVSMFLDEARIAARIRHPNVVPTIDVVATSGELFLVMEYIAGESLSRLARVMKDRQSRVPPRIAASIVMGTLHGLEAAHEAKNESGQPLSIVHRDVSPQNVLVGTDGIARVLDFGVAKASGRLQATREGQLKGKLCYMAPEHFEGKVTRQTDVYAAAIILWEQLTGQRLFAADTEAETLRKALSLPVDPPSRYMRDKGMTGVALAALDRVTLRGLERDPRKRYATAREMALDLERSIAVASASEVGAWVEAAARDAIAQRSETIAEIENTQPSGGPMSDGGLRLTAERLAAARATDPTSTPPPEPRPPIDAVETKMDAVTQTSAVLGTSASSTTDPQAGVPVPGAAPWPRRLPLGRWALAAVGAGALLGGVIALGTRTKNARPSAAVTAPAVLAATEPPSPPQVLTVSTPFEPVVDAAVAAPEHPATALAPARTPVAPAAKPPREAPRGPQVGTKPSPPAPPPTSRTPTYL